MLVTAHIAHWALGMLEAMPVVVVLVVVVWKLRSDRRVASES